LSKVALEELVEAAVVEAGALAASMSLMSDERF